MPKPDCSELAAAVARLALHIGTRPEMKTLAHVTEEMQKYVPEISRDEVVRAIVEATEGHQRALDEVAQRVGDLKREAKSDAALRVKIRELEQHLKDDTVPTPGEPKPDRSSEVVKKLRETRDELKKQVAGSDPAMREKLGKQIDALTKKLEAPAAPPIRTENGPHSKEIDKLAYERDRLRQALNQKIHDLKPRAYWSNAAEPLNAARALVTSLDFSAVLRQGGFIAFGNPGRAIKALGPMFKAFASPFRAHKINTEILSRPNAPLYARSKLYLAQEGGSLSAKEEAFMSRWVKKIPGVAGSERAYNTFLNVLRADTFDAMTETLAKNSAATLPESQAIAEYINAATGRGDLHSFERAGQTLNTVFFSPRYVVSRFQLLSGQGVLHGGGTARTRMLIAREYGKTLAGLGVVYGLGVAAGATVETDPRSSDFMKLKIGNTRIDPLMGLQQIIVAGARGWTGESKSLKTGKVSKIETGKVLTRFARSKLAPVPGALLDLKTGEDAVGRKVTPSETLTKLVVPISFSDIKSAMEEHGVEKGAAIGLLNLFGMGSQTHKEER